MLQWIIFYYFILYGIILYYTILYCNYDRISYHSVFYCIILEYVMLYYDVLLYCTIALFLYKYTILCYAATHDLILYVSCRSALYCSISTMFCYHKTWHNRTWCNFVLYGSGFLLCFARPYCCILYCIVLYCTIWVIVHYVPYL